MAQILLPSKQSKMDKINNIFEALEILRIIVVLIERSIWFHIYLFNIAQASFASYETDLLDTEWKL